MAEIGWVSIYRKIRDCVIWDCDEPFDRRSAWIDLILMANHEDKRILFNGNPMTVKIGQRITSMRKLADRWHWSRDKVKRYLDMLEGEEMIVKECDTNKTLITIVNYENYQGESVADKPLKSHRKATDKATDETQKSHRQVLNNNENNSNNDNKNIYGFYKHVKLSEDDLKKLEDEYGTLMTNACITYLDEYIEMKGYKAKNHYLCIRKWVVDAVKEKKGKSKKGFTSGEGSNGMNELIRMMEG